MTDHAVPTPGPRTLADQIRHCAQRTAEPGNDGQRAGIAVTLQGIANQVQQIELRAATGETEVRDAIRRLLPHGGFDLAAMRGHGIPGVNANTRDGKDALVIRCRCMRRLEWPADEPLPMDILLCWLIDHDDEMFLTPRELEAKYAARLAAPPVALDPFGLPLAYDPLGALGLPPQAVQDGPQRHPAAPAAAETDAEPRQDICEPQEPAQAATGYHANRRRQNPGGER